MSKYRDFCKEELQCYMERDPSLHSLWEVRCMPGYKAIKSWYKTHWLYLHHHPVIARILSLRCQRKTGVDIHPGATIGKRLFIDHGVGVVIGETCILGDDIFIYQGVTLGSTGKENGKRHPNVEDGVFIGAGAKILGNITLGKESKIGAGAIVVRDVEPHTTVVSPPAYPVLEKKGKLSALCPKGHVRWRNEPQEKGKEKNPEMLLDIITICSKEEE